MNGLDALRPLPQAGFGGGCHWCTEAVFQALKGVVEVHQGFIASDPPDDALSEAAMISWDPRLISLQDLIAVHLATHSSTSNHRMRDRYRSAIYVTDGGDGAAARAELDRLSQQTGSRFVTRVLPLRRFVASDPSFHDYYNRNRGGQFCESYIEPKLALLRQRHADLQKDRIGL